MKGTVDKDGQLMLVEFSYPSFFDDKDLLFARTMGMASCILSFWISGNKSLITTNQIDEILTQLHIIQYNEEKQSRFKQGEEFAAVFKGIKYSKQLDENKKFSIFRVIKANADELDTVE